MTIRSGGTLTLRNRTQAPHTLSLVNLGNRPRTFGQMEKCFGKDGACATILTAHGVTAPESEPTTPLVLAVADGFDRAGDLVFFASESLPLKITAAKGRKLDCVRTIHSWMQGRIVVR